MKDNVRIARVEAIAPALDMLQQFYTEEGFTTPPEHLEAPLRTLLVDPQSAVLLAWWGEEAVGVAVVTTGIGIEQAGRYAELTDLYVLPRFRSRGVGRALIAAAIGWCRAQGYPSMEVTVTPEGQAAHNLVNYYRSQGFRDTGRTLLEFDFSIESASSVKNPGRPAAVPAAETFDGTWPFEANYTQAPGFRMHYVDEGNGRETLLLLHGEPTWGYLFRHLIPALAREHRVLVPDHMGFGKSETPTDRTYWLQDHIDNLEKFVLALDLRKITLVVHDFGGPVGMGLAIRHPDRIRHVISVNGPTPMGQPDLAQRLSANARVSPWFQWIAKAHRESVLEQVLGQLDYNILSTMKLNGFERNEIVSDPWLRAYRAPFPTPGHALGAIGWARGFAEGRHRFDVPDESIRAALVKKPALAIWGLADRTLRAEHFLPLFESAFPGAPIHRLSGVGHYSPEDAPGTIARLIDAFLSPA